MQLNNETYIRVSEDEDIVTSYICSILDNVLITASVIATIVVTGILALFLRAVTHGESIDIEYIIGVVSVGCISGIIFTVIPSDEKLRYQVISKIINRKKDK